MADPDHDRGRRRRHRGRRRFEDRLGEREIDEGPVISATTPTKPPIILSKPPSEKNTEDSMSPNVSGSVVSQPVLTANTPRSSADKPVVMLRSRDEGRAHPSASLPSIPSALMSGEISQSYQVHQRSGVAGYQVMRDGSACRQSGQGDKLRSIKLVDDNWHWCEGGMEMLLDQSDYLVVGVLGLQGVGKSTLLSLLLGNSTKDASRSFVFPQQSKEVIDIGGHQTCGIDMYVTGERIIYLDTQPVMSASVMDHLIRYDKKYPTEFTSVENCVHMQSLQLAAFMLTVCNVVLVVQDCFADLTFLRFLSTAEMLKPASPSTSASETSSSPDDHPDHQPHIVFIQNRAGRDDYSVGTFREYQQTLSQVFRDSKLRLKGSVSLANGSVIPGLNRNTIQSDVNLFLLPTYDLPAPKKEEALSEYRGYPSFASLLKCLKSQLYSVPRYLLTHTTLTEKNWFHYAARTWDQVRKSQMMSEYNRILP